ncbi:MAG: cyclase family protein [Clostridia bacterium]|nr:cyclase family protein [Clostridia bacterium]
MKLIDISRKFFGGEVYPGDPLPEAEQICEIGEASGCNLSVIHACVHNATHVDAPLHFISDGDAIENLPIESFIGPCTVMQVPEGVITGDYVDRCFPKKCGRLLIKGGGKAFFMDSSAQELAERGLILIGTDSLSVGCKGNQTGPHKAFLQNNVAVLEGLDLSRVQPGEYFLFAPPVCYNGLEGAPARAVLIEDYIFWSGSKRGVK